MPRCPVERCSPCSCRVLYGSDQTSTWQLAPDLSTLATTTRERGSVLTRSLVTSGGTGSALELDKSARAHTRHGHLLGDFLLGALRHAWPAINDATCTTRDRCNTCCLCNCVALPFSSQREATHTYTLKFAAEDISAMETSCAWRS